jgi:hypothetical protein
VVAPAADGTADFSKLIAAIQFGESFEVAGPEMYKHACSVDLGLKGPRQPLSRRLRQ